MRRREQALIDEAARWEKGARELDAGDQNGCVSVDLAKSAETRQVSSLSDTIAKMTRARQLAELRITSTAWRLLRIKATRPGRNPIAPCRPHATASMRYSHRRVGE